MKRFISWPGAKYRQLKMLLQYATNIGVGTALCEPFFGTGCFTMHFIRKARGRVYASDSCEPLYSWWNYLINHTDIFVKELARASEHVRNSVNSKEDFALLRNQWNQLNEDDPGSIEVAALLWPMIYKSTNNLARFNKTGKYGQSYGHGRNIPNTEAVFDSEGIEIIEYLREGMATGCFVRSCFECLDLFLYDLNSVNGAFCFLDPPYIVSNDVYSRGSWGIEDVYRLRGIIQDLENAGVPWMMTEYFKKGDVVHPLAEDYRSNFRVFPLDRKCDAAPRMAQVPADEVVVVGSSNRINETLF